MASTTSILFSLLVSLALSSFFIETVCGDPGTIEFRNAFGANETPIGLICSVGDSPVASQTIAPGGSYELFIVTPNTYKCTATWTPLAVDFDAYNKERDGGNLRLFWKTDRTGWYLSYDGVTFTKRAEWAGRQANIVV